MENRVAYGLVAIATAVVGDLEGEGGAGNNELAIEIRGLVRIGRTQPLVRVKVMHMGRVLAGVVDSHFHMVPHVAVVNV